MTLRKMSTLIPQEVAEQRIFLVRGQRIMLSNHLAELYGVETRVLIQAVKRNAERFPHDFMFPLSRQEILRISQIVTSLKYSKSVYAFTEQGVAMLSGVLHSSRAIQANIVIMRAFVKLRNVLSTHKELVYRLKELERKTGKHLRKHDVEIRAIFEAIRQMMIIEERPKRQIGFIKNS